MISKVKKEDRIMLQNGLLNLSSGVETKKMKFSIDKIFLIWLTRKRHNIKEQRETNKKKLDQTFPIG